MLVYSHGWSGTEGFIVVFSDSSKQNKEKDKHKEKTKPPTSSKEHSSHNNHHKKHSEHNKDSKEKTHHHRTNSEPKSNKTVSKRKIPIVKNNSVKDSDEKHKPTAKTAPHKFRSTGNSEMQILQQRFFCALLEVFINWLQFFISHCCCVMMHNITINTVNMETV